ncbi:MAG: GspE/PulE family protein [Planctomycetota bacterium]|jgi:type II secretory ATPase GspE/PulE/Tfp pilus assembly ATPase PilB-like protein
MPDLLLSSAEYTGYISIIKFLVFLVLFFLWLPIVGWVYNDAKAVGTKEVMWTAVLLATGASAVIIFLFIPVFLIGALIYAIAVATASLIYVKHRNSRVMDYARVLTAEHIKSLFSAKEKELDELKGFLFVTANNNEVPLPQAQTPDFFGYKSAYEILTDATWRRASDIIFTPASQNYSVTYYVDGSALKQPPIARGQLEYSINLLKTLADLDTKEKRKPQKGIFKVRRGKNDTEWEITTAGSTAGEQIRLQKVVQQSASRLEDIGLMPEQLEQLNTLKNLKQGLFIVTGPQKTGVTTTFYALLRNHDAFINSINTLERHPTAELPNITQNAFTLSDTGTSTYAKKLQEIIRMGPDIVGVADCQNTETAQSTCMAAKDGKIMYTTLPADSVVMAVGKWLKLVGDRNLAAQQTLLGICNQRLIRKLCEECKQAYAPNKELLRKFNIPAEKVTALYRTGKVIIGKRGKEMTCDQCQGTGYVGRTGIFEIISINDQLRKTIIQSKSLSEIGAQFRATKMLYLQEQALRKVINGTTSINEMIRVLSPKTKPKAK